MNNLESQLLAFESTIGKQLTLIDNHGFFIDEAGSSIYPRTRHSHQSLTSCKAGFCMKRCVQHCRHTNNHYFETTSEIKIDKCWNGLVQLAIPLIVDGRHEGTLYLGNWREKKYYKKSKITKSAWLKVPYYNDDEIEVYKNWLQLIANGILHSVLQEKIPSDPKAKELLQWVNENLSKKPRLDDLAESWGVTPNHCSHKCKKLTGMSFSDLIISNRIKRCKALLNNTKLSLGEIASQLGFNDAYHLGKQFKNIVGESPGQFRKTSIVGGESK
ncbi:MAG: hypothetical protein COA79_08740 [Planctomycetota bacterium]|nr:MAG: hypothetical protein COA79_08740 [Planctomycetota bacterium]